MQNIHNWSIKQLKIFLIFRHINLYWFNPNYIQWGQSWPYELWRQIADTLLIYFIFEKNLFLQKPLTNLFELNTGRQKIMFWCHFHEFTQKNPSMVPPRHTPMLGFTVLMSSAEQSAARVWSSAGSAQSLILNGRQLELHSGPIVKTIAPHDNLGITGGDSLGLGKARSKLSGLLYLTVSPEPG